MNEKYPTRLNGNPEQESIQAQLDSLTKELEAIQVKTNNFENILRSHLEDVLIEVQELTVLYKQQKAAKKEKRLHQKKQGKNFKEEKGLQSLIKEKTSQKDPNEQREKKRLYREAMLHVHPDKFSMQVDKVDLATEITIKLMDIYTTGDLETLRAYHAHIFHDTDLVPNDVVSQLRKLPTKGNYLQMEIQKILKLIEEAKNRHTYKVLSEYENPMTFLDELMAYYEDRLFKLKKRTRKG